MVFGYGVWVGSFINVYLQKYYITDIVYSTTHQCLDFCNIQAETVFIRGKVISTIVFPIGICALVPLLGTMNDLYPRDFFKTFFRLLVRPLMPSITEMMADGYDISYIYLLHVPERTDFYFILDICTLKFTNFLLLLAHNWILSCWSTCGSYNLFWTYYLVKFW